MNNCKSIREQLGTVGSSLRLEALKLEIVKDATADTDLTAYTALIKQIESLNEADYSKTSWANLQTVLKNHTVTDQNTAAEVTEAVKVLEAAIQKLENMTQATVYDKAGTYGPTNGSETISQNVVITASGVTLQNLTIDGNLVIDEAVGNGNVTLNNVNVSGELRVRGGGKNSIHISGGKYAQILVEQAPDGGVRIVATGLDGVPVVLSENAAGETLILEGTFDSLTIGAPDTVVKTQGQTSIKSVDITVEAKNATIDLGSTTTVANLAIASPTKVTGTGAISKAEIASDNVSFEKAPGNYTVDPVVVIPPVIPTPPSGGGSSGGGYTPPAKLNLSATDPAVALTKTYDGNTTTNVTNQVLDGSAVTGILSGDDVQVVATATYDNKTAGNNKDITISYSLSGTNANKYNPPAATTVTGEIIPKALVSATTTIAKEFDGTATLETVITENLGQVNTDTLTITRTATYQNNSGKTDAIEVGTDKPVTCSYTLSGADAVNYLAPADHPATGTITKRTLTVTAASLNINKNKTYDATTDVFNSNGKIAAGNNAISVATGVAADPNINVTATAVYDNQNAGINNRSITVSYTIDSSPANKRYQIAAMEPISGASITARPLTITAPTPVAKAYDGTADVFTDAGNTGKIYNLPITFINPVAGSTSADVTVTATAIYDGGKDVGPNKNITIHYTLAGEAAGNYIAPSDDHSKTSDITPLTLNTGSVTEKTKEYDGTSTATKLIIPLSCSNNNGVFQDEAGKTLSSKIVADYYTDNKCKTKCSQVGDNLYIKYTISLDGASAGNYVFEGGEKTLTATTNGGSITAKKLTVSAADLGLQTEKTYDGNTSTNVNNPTFTDNNGLTGIVGTEKVTATVSSYYANADAGDRNITTTFSLSGSDSSNYCIDPLTSSGKIKPIQLEVDSTKLPAIAATRKYDATTDVYLDGTSTKLSDYPLAADAVSGLINNEVVTVKATASYDNKNCNSDGSAKPVTINFTLEGEGAKNYLAPAPDTSKSADITPRILGYANVTLVTMKKADSSSSVTFINTPNADSTTYGGMDGVARIDGTNTQENVYLGSYHADYYDSSNNKTSAVGSNYAIKLSGTLAGADAGNYVLTDYVYNQTGQILNANAVISTPYNSTSWNVVGILSAPAATFKLFYAKQDGSTTFYAHDGDGKIYRSTDLSTWTVVTQVTLDGSKQLIGIDNSGNPLAIITPDPDPDQDGNTSHPVYSWTGNSWSSNDSLQNIEPSNPTYYADSTYDYLIYQDATSKFVYSLSFIKDSISTEIESNSAPSLPSGFTNSLLVYNGSNLTLYAY